MSNEREIKIGQIRISRRNAIKYGVFYAMGLATMAALDWSGTTGRGFKNVQRTAYDVRKNIGESIQNLGETIKPDEPRP